jgi:integrase
MHSETRVVQFRGKWCLYWREDGEARRRVITDASGKPVTTREDAERARLDTERLALKPIGDLIGDLAEKYFRDKKGRIASYDNMEYAWKGIKPDVGHLRPEHITREWCQEYINQQRAKPKRSDGTIRKALTVLSAICRWNNKNTPAIIEMPPLPPSRDRYLTRREARKLIKAATGNLYQPHVRLFIILALATGARMSAILELKWDQIDLKRGMIDLGKSVGNKGRSKVPMTETVREALEEAKKAALTDFVIEYAGKQVKSVKKGFALAVKRAKLPGKVHPHVCRHTAAVWMAEDGHSMAEIAQVLGHTNESVTFRTYARYSPTHLRKPISSLELDLDIDDSEETDDES